MWSRDEHDPHGPLVLKRVEELFRRFAKVLHLHAGGQLIRTTAEHPFHAKGTGWTPAGALRAGDEVWTDDGRWVGVEEVYDTGEYEPVYNLRVADFHTYFVGDEGWGWGLWAHNAWCGPYDDAPNPRTPGHQAHHIGQHAVLRSLPIIPGKRRYSKGAAPAIELFGGSYLPGSAHDAATSKQRQRNAALIRSGQTTMTIGQQAKIAEEALQAARRAPIQGPSGPITQKEIAERMEAFWSYVESIGANANTVVEIPR